MISSKASALSKITKPRDCLLGICLPLTRDEFLEDLDHHSGKDYARCRERKLGLRPEALWEIDHKPLAQFLNALCQTLGDYGVNVIKGFTPEHLPQITGHQVFTVVAHWVKSERAVEMKDRLIAADEFAQRIPEDFDGIIDLTVCNSEHLREVIARKSDNIVIHNKNTTSIEYRMTLYKYCMKYLIAHDDNYLNAIAEVR